MSNGQESRTHRMEAQRKRAAEALKRCPLCDAINAMSNEECFVCTWRGTFDHDPVNVEAGLGELLERCPELADAMMSPATEPIESAPVARWRTFCQAFRRFWLMPSAARFFRRRCA